jgi:hypothetical protein
MFSAEADPSLHWCSSLRQFQLLQIHKSFFIYFASGSTSWTLGTFWWTGALPSLVTFELVPKRLVNFKSLTAT